MAVSKETLVAKQAVSFATQIEEFERTIDVKLLERYSGAGTVTVDIPPSDKFNSTVCLGSIIKKYQDIGWKVEAKHDQREGNWLSFE